MVIESGSPLQHIRLIQLIPDRDRTTSLSNSIRPISKEWLQRHDPFDVVIDGANVGLINRHNFNFSQLNSIVNQLHQMRPSKRLLLLVLHKSHVTGGPAQSHNNKKLLENWKRSGALYATPTGSNDDWCGVCCLVQEFKELGY
ncbi:proteinaceous RNase P 1, chloroplastic/mitochondrial-like isoform X2 [Camellia sinensis]|uniref:proteinaceous RNase P 1, chloroplastic/mitochondrial-like isoform X2 n=1 Tax=Camellia sinensis TaxID=4442 RepID=UPI00103681C2|nr:proteinaceous RNase P 1, chloroplastic/mitochondrial-like isoform X2 [Camellia sinensis]